MDRFLNNVVRKHPDVEFVLQLNSHMRNIVSPLLLWNDNLFRTMMSHENIKKGLPRNLVFLHDRSSGSGGAATEVDETTGEVFSSGDYVKRAVGAVKRDEATGEIAEPHVQKGPDSLLKPYSIDTDGKPEIPNLYGFAGGFGPATVAEKLIDIDSLVKIQQEVALKER